MESRQTARRAGSADLELATVITLAFAEDPLWGWALARPDGGIDHHRAFWRLFLEGALRYQSSWITDSGGAASIWIPPGGTEMTSDQERAWRNSRSTTSGQEPTRTSSCWSAWNQPILATKSTTTSVFSERTPTDAVRESACRC